MMSVPQPTTGIHIGFITASTVILTLRCALFDEAFKMASEESLALESTHTARGTDNQWLVHLTLALQ